MVVLQGDVYWITLGKPRGSEPALRHPYVVIQNDVFNASAIATVIAVAVTSNLARGASPGNVQLRKGEANLPKASVVNVTQVMTLDKSDLKEKIGRLSRARVAEILDGLRLVTKQTDI